MASPFRSTSTNEGNNGQDCNATPPGALAVVPLCSMPYIGPPAPSNQNQVKPVEKAGPTDETVNPGVHMLGSAAKGKVGHIVGLVDIGESDDAYIFRVSLPGAARGEKDFSCNVESDGKVVIKGVTTTGEKTVCRHSQIFRMKTQNLCPPGHFSITFQLPGPVDKQQFKGCFGIDGILEGLVKKQK